MEHTEFREGNADMANAPPSQWDRLIAVRFAGDSGDGVQLAGALFSHAAGISGAGFFCTVEFPAEIRAPSGTLHGVSSQQVRIGPAPVRTAGDAPDLALALNPAALRKILPDLAGGTTVVIDSGAFDDRAIDRADWCCDPRDDSTLAPFEVLAPDITALTQSAVKTVGGNRTAAHRARNCCVLGLALALCDVPLAAGEAAINARFEGDEAQFNRAALAAGYHWRDGAAGSQVSARPSSSRKGLRAPGNWRIATGSETLCWGLVAAAERAGLHLFCGGYPITPATSILQFFTDRNSAHLRAFQAEDEIAGIAAAIGAAFAGRLAVTATSGPGLSLKSEALGLAVMAELPLVVIDAQRGGPSTGIPTRSEQTDLMIALHGRHGAAPLPVLAVTDPADAFDTAFLAARIAVERMTPVILLTDGYLQNATVPWRLPDVTVLPAIRSVRPVAETGKFNPYARIEGAAARPWAVPGTAGFVHRIGGLEKDDLTGESSHDPEVHARMTALRQAKVRHSADLVPRMTVESGPNEGPLALVGWGSTHGALTEAATLLRARGIAVAHLHPRLLSPLQTGLVEALGRYDKVIVAELNDGQFAAVLRAEGVTARAGRQVESLAQLDGRPFRVTDLISRIQNMLDKETTP